MYRGSFSAYEGKYYLAHPNLKWIKTTMRALNGSNSFKLITDEYFPGTFAARVTVESISRVYQTIGVVQRGVLFYLGEGKGESVDTQYMTNVNREIEVLACVPDGTSEKT